MFGFNISILQGDYEGPGATSSGCSSVAEDSPFAADVKALRDFNYGLKAGDVIKMTLQEALSVMPRKRPRTDAYKALVKWLSEEKDIELIITSNKTKRNL